MNKQLVYAILDRSGSMAGKEQDTVGGFNTTIEELKKNKKREESILISVKLFDHEQSIIKNLINIESINANLNISEFTPRGQTALYDALGDTVNDMIAKKRENKNFYDTCLIYVFTDGLENCSKKYDKCHLKNIIEDAETNHNIKILYLGANQDAIFEASKLGINIGHAINYQESNESTDAVFRSLGRACTSYRNGEDCTFTQVERQRSAPSVLKRQKNHSSQSPSLKNLYNYQDTNHNINVPLLSRQYANSIPLPPPPPSPIKKRNQN